MRYFKHPETSLFSLKPTYRGRLFAIPILLHPQLLNAGVNPLAGLDYQALGQVMSETKVLSPEDQGLTLLSRVVDAHFVCRARGDKRKSLLKTLVSLHQSMPEFSNPEDLGGIRGFNPAGGGLVFLIGAVYRRIIDPLPVTLPYPDDFLASRARFDMELALGGGKPGLFRHQIYAPVLPSTAITYGLSEAMQRWNGLFDGPGSCEFDLNAQGDVTMQLKLGDDSRVALRFGHDATTETDLQVIQGKMIPNASRLGCGPGYYRH